PIKLSSMWTQPHVFHEILVCSPTAANRYAPSTVTIKTVSFWICASQYHCSPTQIGRSTLTWLFHVAPSIWDQAWLSPHRKCESECAESAYALSDLICTYMPSRFQAQHHGSF